MKAEKLMDGQVVLYLENQNEIDAVAALLRSRFLGMSVNLGEADVANTIDTFKEACSEEVHIKYSNVKKILDWDLINKLCQEIIVDLTTERGHTEQE